MKKRLFSFISIVVGFVVALAAVEVMAAKATAPATAWWRGSASCWL